MPATAFKPSIHGFKFRNSFNLEDILDELADAPSWMVPQTNDSGLCGGMCFAALDRYFRGEEIPQNVTSPPVKGDSLFSKLVTRFMDSLDSVGVPNVLDYQERPDEGQRWNPRHSLGHLTLTEQWPSVRRKIDEGIPTTLCLIRAEAWEPIWRNHQVVVFGYTIAGEEVTLNIYDPNQPAADRVVVGFKTDQPHSALHIYQEPKQESTPNPRGFLRVPYDRKEVVVPLPTVPQAEESMEWLWTVLA